MGGMSVSLLNPQRRWNVVDSATNPLCRILDRFAHFQQRIGDGTTMVLAAVHRATEYWNRQTLSTTETTTPSCLDSEASPATQSGIDDELDRAVKRSVAVSPSPCSPAGRIGSTGAASEMTGAAFGVSSGGREGQAAVASPTSSPVMTLKLTRGHIRSLSAETPTSTGPVNDSPHKPAASTAARATSSAPAKKPTALRVYRRKRKRQPSSEQ